MAVEDSGVDDLISISKKRRASIRREFYSVGGRVTNAAGAPVPEAVVRLLRRGKVTKTGADGLYIFSGLAAGKYVLSVRSGATAHRARITVPAPPGTDYSVQMT